MQSKILFIVGCLVIAGYGCGMHVAGVRTEQPQHQFRAIVHIETREQITTVMSGPDGRAYTVRTKDGGNLEEGISEQQLHAKFPDIYRLIKTAYVGEGNSIATWAGGNL